VLRIEIPDRSPLELDHLVCDFNGTLALDGWLLAGVDEQLATLARSLTVSVLTAGTHGNLDDARQRLTQTCVAAGVPAPTWQIVRTGADKRVYLDGFGPERVVAVGNGANDEAMFRAAALGIAVLGGEGLYVGTLVAAAVVAGSPTEALDLLLHPARLVATLRP
jgi:soluble P-type ATPase